MSAPEPVRNPWISDADLEAYLEEALDVEWMSRIEGEVRKDQGLLQRLAEINQRRDTGWHTLGDIWRRHRVSCPTREQLGSYLLDALDPNVRDYVFFHLTDVGCRYCQASLKDLQQKSKESSQVVEARRRRYFQSSAGYL
jgi:hypothetical protein